MINDTITYYDRFIARARRRQLRALVWHNAGKTYAWIAARLRISRQRAWTIVQRAKQLEET